MAREVEYKINDARSPEERSSLALTTIYPPYHNTIKIPILAKNVLLIVKKPALR